MTPRDRRPGEGPAGGGGRAIRTSPLPPADFGKAPTETSAPRLLATWRPRPADQLEWEVLGSAEGPGWDGGYRQAPHLGKGG